MKCPTLKEIKKLFNCICYRESNSKPLMKGYESITFYIGGYFEGQTGTLTTSGLGIITLYPTITFIIHSGEVERISYKIYKYLPRNCDIIVSEDWPNHKTHKKMIKKIKDNLKFIKLKRIS